MLTEILKYNIGEGVCAFTTKRTLGRDKSRICQLVGIPESHFLMPHQTHGTEIIEIIEIETSKDALEAKDAIMTNLPNVLIGVSTADCIPVLLYDEVHRAVAAVHAGWKGTVMRIVEKSVLRMQEAYNTNPADLKAIICPGISQKNFEVGDEVYDLFAQEFQHSTFNIQHFSARTDKWHLDLKECNRLQLLKMGVKPNNIEVSPICTYDDSSYFSARREQKDTTHKCGRNFNAIMLL